MITSANLSLPADFAADSRAWVYQADRPFTAAEAAEATRLLENFIGDWNSHGHPVKGFAGLYYQQFIVLLADETAAGVSGCSTDSSVRVIREIGQQTGVRLFDRLSLAFLVEDKVRLIPMPQLAEAFETGTITAETLYFNNIVKDKRELETDWLVPAKRSWLGQRYFRATTGVAATGAAAR